MEGVLAADIFVDTFSSLIETESVPDNSYLFLVDCNNGLVVHINTDYGYVDDEPMPMEDIPDRIYEPLKMIWQFTERTRLANSRWNLMD